MSWRFVAVLTANIVVSLVSVGVSDEIKEGAGSSANVENVSEIPVLEPVEVSLTKLEMSDDLLRQQFVACVYLQSIEEATADALDREFSEPLKRTPVMNSLFFLTNFVRARREPFGNVAKALIDAASKESGPKNDDALSFLVSDDADKYVRFHYAKGKGIEVMVFAPTEALANERGEAFMRLYRECCLGPIHEMFERRLGEATKDMIESRKQADELEASANRMDAELEESSDVEGIDFNRLKNERAMLGVKLAGVEARIDAAKSLSKQAVVVERISDMLLSSTIELAGLRAEREAISGVIEAVEKRRELVAKSRVARRDVTALRQRIESHDRGTATFQQCIVDVERVSSQASFAVRPIRWVK
ncbi:MAG: hypothetical protein KDB23_17300 [Planctomycetales bacterium]|nr:hypothetical protein [Planctomycetales bacterium]